jgi:uncharacterized protein
MLKVDLAQLERQRRLPVEVDLPADALDTGRDDVRFRAPIAVRLEAQQAGADVLVRGTIEGQAELECRRCLKPVTHEMAEEVLFLYREDAEPGETEDVFPLPARARELDLTDAVRELLLLSLPGYMVCDEACRGFCPHCGVNRNEAACDCAPDDGDNRWAALRNLKSD